MSRNLFRVTEVISVTEHEHHLRRNSILGMNKKRFFKLTFFVLLFPGFIVAWLGFGERGFLHLYRMEADRQAYLERIRGIEEENEALMEEIQRLKTDMKYLESVARKRLGLVKEDEILYRFSREQKGHPSTETGMN